MSEVAIKRLNWGCGNWRPVGWINSDIKEGEGIDLSCDITEGLPLDDNSLDYAVSMCALQEVSYANLIPVLRELRRVLKPGGVLRLGLADLDKGIAAYQQHRRDYFQVPDTEVTSLSSKFVVHMLWYGYSKLLFTREFIEEALLKAGFSRVVHCRFKETSSPWPEILELDNREEECLFVEAEK